MATEYWARIGYGDNYSNGPYETRDAAFAKLCHENPSSAIFVGKKDEISKESIVACLDADIVLDHMACNLAERVGELADDWPGATSEQEVELANYLQSTVIAWLSRHGIEPSFFGISEIEERAPSP